MLVEVVKIIHSIGTIIGWLNTLIVIVLFAKKVISYLAVKRHIIKMLRLSKKKCMLSYPIYQSSGSVSFEHVTHSSVLIYQELQDLLQEINVKLMIYKSDHTDFDVFHVGGPLANNKVNALLAECKWNMRFRVPDTEKEDYEKSNLYSKCIDYYDGNYPQISIGETMLSIDKNTKDYAIFIRTPADKSRNIEHTTHIIFAYWEKGTLSAVRFFTHNYKWFAKEFKEDRYCIAIPINMTGSEPTLAVEGLRDCTREFFGTN